MGPLFWPWTRVVPSSIHVLKNIKNTNKTLLLKKRRSLLHLFIRLLLLLKHKNLKNIKKTRCKVLPLLQLWWPILALPQILLQLQLLLVVNQLSLHPIRMGHLTQWPLSTSATWPRMSLRPCFLKSSPLRDPFYLSESGEKFDEEYQVRKRDMEIHNL